MVRTVEIDDIQALLEMQCLLDKQTKNMMFEEGERPRSLEKLKAEVLRLKEQGSLMLVAEKDNKIVGFLTAERGAFQRIHHTAHIVIGILKGYRGLGLGTKLFKELDKWSKQNHITRLELTVMCHNKEGIALYRKNGFEIEGIKKHSMYVDNTYIDEYYMAKVMS